MTYLNLGSKSGAFHRDGQSWYCTTGLPSDVCVEIGEMSFHLHKFPLISRCGLLEKLIEEFSNEDGSICILQLNEIPGGAKAFELVTKFCYGVKIELSALNVVSLRCAAEYLQMNEEHGEGNLIFKTEGFLNEIFSNWTQSIQALETCEEVLPYAEELHIVTRCIDSLAIKACSDTSLFNWPCNETQTPADIAMWNGIYSAPKPRPVGDDWWHKDVSLLSLPLFKRFVLAVELRGMKPESVAAALVYYAKRYLPLMNRLSSFKDTNNVNPEATISAPSEPDQRILLQEIVELLPNKKGVTSTKVLLRLLRTAMTLHASTLCRENLERRAGAQLDNATVEDLLIPNVGYSVETMYDIDCVQRILDHFVSVDQAAAAASFSPSMVEDGKFMSGTDSLTPMTLVANLVDGYLAEMAPDVNLKLPKFQALAAVIPDYARPTSDGMYHAIDVYLKAHQWLTDSEREQLCRLMNCQKLSLDASSHAAQNERLPLRVIVQVLFFEQLRLRTSISGWFFVSENLENSQNQSANIQRDATQDRVVGAADMKERVSGLEKECLGMKEELQKLTTMKKSWSLLPKKFFARQKPHPCNSSESKPSKSRPVDSKNHENVRVDH